VQHGVRGHHRFIPLEGHLLFCSETCLRSHVEDVPTMPPRIP
jgi:hypothetical protein